MSRPHTAYESVSVTYSATTTDTMNYLRRENDKLRELVSELWLSCPVHDSDCDECTHKGGLKGCELYDSMLELGVDA